MLCPNCKTTLGLKYSQVNNFDILFCGYCFTGFTYPTPNNLSKYYHSNYWLSPGLLGVIKISLFKICQNRRKNWINKYLTKGEILDVGAGEGIFGESLENKFKVTSIDTPSSEIKNKNVLRVNFLSWKTEKKFDAIVFWESLEHTDHPYKYLQKAVKLLKRHGLIFIEYPRFDSLESKVFKQHWFHLDPPRHLMHLSEKGLEGMLNQTMMRKEFHTTTPALEYTIWGTVASILSIFNIKRTDIIKQSNNLVFMILLLPLFILALILQFILFLMGQSPIGLIVVRKYS